MKERNHDLRFFTFEFLFIIKKLCIVDIKCVNFFCKALGRPRGIGWRGRWEGGSGWGIHVYPRLIHVNV